MTCNPDHTRLFPKRGFILAAGLGERMRPLTNLRPKPLIKVKDKALIDYSIEKLDHIGVQEIIVNAHYLSDQIESHCKNIQKPTIQISKEQKQLLETGGGIKNALTRLGPNPFILMNGDSFWVETNRSNLLMLCQKWNCTKMDALLLLSTHDTAIGYDGAGDFFMAPDGRLRRRGTELFAPYIYTGSAIFHPRAFDDMPQEAFSLNLVFDHLIRNKRLFGANMDGTWFHVGTPQAVQEVESILAKRLA